MTCDSAVWNIVAVVLGLAPPTPRQVLRNKPICISIDLYSRWIYKLTLTASATHCELVDLLFSRRINVQNDETCSAAHVIILII